MNIQHLIPILFLAAFCTVGAQTNSTAAIRVQLLGITNDAAGTKLAKYELLNSGKDRLWMLLPVEVDYGEQFNFSGRIPTGAVLKTGEPMEMSIPVERCSSRWRVTFDLVGYSGNFVATKAAAFN